MSWTILTLLGIATIIFMVTGAFCFIAIAIEAIIDYLNGKKTYEIKIPRGPKKS